MAQEERKESSRWAWVWTWLDRIVKLAKLDEILGGQIAWVILSIISLALVYIGNWLGNWRVAFWLMVAVNAASLGYFRYRVKTLKNAAIATTVPVVICDSSPTPTPPPHFEDFKKGEYEGLLWEWTWLPGAHTPRLEMILELTSRCALPGCETQIVLKDEHIPDATPSTSDELYSGHSRRSRSVGFVRVICVARCDACRKGPTFPESSAEVIARVKRLIEGDARKRKPPVDPPRRNIDVPSTPAAIAEPDTITTSTPVDDRKYWPGRPLHGLLEFMERRRWERVFERNGIEWRVVHNDGNIMEEPSPRCPLCHDDLQAALIVAEGKPGTDIVCTNERCQFSKQIPLHYSDIRPDAQEWIESELRRESRA